MPEEKWKRALQAQVTSSTYRMNEAGNGSLPSMWELLFRSRHPASLMLWKYLTPRLPRLGLIGVLSLVRTVLEAVGLILLVMILGLVIGTPSGAEPSINLLGLGFSLPFLSTLVSQSGGFTFGLLALVGLKLASAAVDVLGIHLAQKLQVALSCEVRRDLFDKLLRLKLGFFTVNKPGDVAYIEGTLVNRFAALIPSLQGALSLAVDLAMSMVLLVSISGWMTLSLGILAFCLSILLNRFSFRAKRQSQELEEAGQKTSTTFLETLYSIRLVKQGDQQGRARRKYLDLVWDRESRTLRLQDYQAINRALSELGSLAVLLLAAYISSVLNGLNIVENASLGLAYIYIAMRALGDVVALQSIRLRLIIMIPQFMMVVQFLLDSEFDESNDEVTLPGFPGVNNKLSVDSVNFGYSPEKQVLKNLNLDFPKGSITAIVGLSGSGKTTLLELIAGSYSPQSGCIRTDGVEIDRYDLNSYRRKVGYVTQEAIILHDTLIENLRYLRQEVTEEEIDLAAERTLVKEFVDGTEQGYETVVGERGLRLSGGQRQRLALARVLLQDPCILLLDEATSALDLYMEAKIIENLVRLKHDKIIIVAAHRLSAVANFDNIIVMNKGIVIEQGTHSELFERKGLYFHLYNIQEFSPEKNLGDIVQAIG